MENKIYKHSYFGDIYYTVHIPQGLIGKKNVPMLLFLHGAGERGRDYSLINLIGPGKYIQEGTRSFDNCITVCPQCPEEYIWNNLAPMLVDFIHYIVEKYSVDIKKISISGISMGGYGTWEMIMFAPDLFYRASPICGGGTPWRTDLIKAQVWAFHGDCDTVVSKENSDMMVFAARENGKDVKYTIYSGVGHDVWNYAYPETTVFDWLTDFKDNN